MAPKARQIPDSRWEKYKGEITALYFAPKGTLKKTRQTMKERHDFHATENQYAAKFKAWGLEKNANHNIWAYAYQKKRKRKLKGKNTEFVIRGKRRSNSEVDENIARNVTYTQRLQLTEDIPTPEGIQAFTPVAEASAVMVREVYIDNLPSFHLIGNIHELLSQVMRNQTSQLSPIFTMLAHPGKHISPSLLDSPSVAFGDILNLFPESKTLNTLERKLSLTSRLLPTYINKYETMLSNFEVARTPSRFVVLNFFMWLFIFSTNSVKGDANFETVDWILQNVGASLLYSLFRLKTIAVKTFMTKIFPGIVNSGNTTVAKIIIDQDVDINGQYLRQKCMTIAVGNRDNRMVELLCQAGFPPRISESYLLERETLPWRIGNLEVLETLLSFESDPECLVRYRERGFPLVDAANSGSLEAVEMLWMKGCRVDVYLPHYFGTPLQAAVSGGHLEIARFLIERGADVVAPCGPSYTKGLQKAFLNYRYSTFMMLPELVALKTPVEIACKENNTMLVEMLLAHGALADISPLSHFAEALPTSFDHVDWIYTALQYSVQNGNIVLVRLLLSRGADPNSRVALNWGNTPLQAAVRLNYPEIAQILIDYGASVNDPPAKSHGRTAIQAAAETGNLQLVQMLLGRNADINAPACEENGFTALQAAIKNNHFTMVSLLLMAGADINAPAAPARGLTAIQAAAKIGDFNLIKYLVEHGADVNSPPSELGGTTTVNAALQLENRLILEFFVEHGAAINGSKNEIPPIMTAADGGWVEGARYLLQKGADVNATSNFDSPLSLSIRNNDIEMVDFLLESGGDLHFPMCYSKDALCLALWEGCSSELILLLLSKYTVSGPNYFDKMVLAAAMDFVNKHEDTSMLRRILKAISELPKSLYEAQVRHAWHDLRFTFGMEDDPDMNESLIIETISILLDAGAEINWKLDPEDETILQCFTDCTYFETSKYLVEKGAEIQTPGGKGRGTPFQDAISNYDIEFAYFLLEHGADINAPPHGGRTALQAAIEGGHNDLVSDLLQRDADVNASPAEKRGVTALQAAAINDNMDVAILLIQHGAHVAAPAAPFEGRTAINGAAERGNLDMLQLLLNHYDGCEDLSEVCQNAASYAEKEEYFEIARWLRGFRPDEQPM